MPTPLEIAEESAKYAWLNCGILEREMQAQDKRITILQNAILKHKAESKYSNVSQKLADIDKELYEVLEKKA